MTPKKEALEETALKLYPNRESFLDRFQDIEREAFIKGYKLAQIEAEKLLEKEKKQQDELAIGFAKWVTGLDLSKKLLEIYKKKL